MTASKAKPRPSSKPFEIGGQTVAPGERLRFDLPAALLPTHTPVEIPLTILHGKRPGPVTWVSAALHGDELNGIEVITQVLDHLREPLERGTLIAAPIVNVFGFINQSRYFPDRRDLNRSFPGSKTGSLASRIAYLFVREVISKCNYGLDLHTASLQRVNLPQVRGNLEDPETLRMAKAFGAPVMVQSGVRKGSLRGTAASRGITALVYEAGEAQRFNPDAIEVGVSGVLRVLRKLRMTEGPKFTAPKSVRLARSTWVRARRGGLLRLMVQTGDRVQEKQVVGTVGDPFGGERVLVRAPFDGVVIGASLNPVVHGGDAVIHVGCRT